MRLCDTDHGHVLDDGGASYQRHRSASGIPVSSVRSDLCRYGGQNFLHGKIDNITCMFHSLYVLCLPTHL